MAAPSEAEINFLLVYKSPARQGGALYSWSYSQFCSHSWVPRHRTQSYVIAIGAARPLKARDSRNYSWRTCSSLPQASTCLQDRRMLNLSCLAVYVWLIGDRTRWFPSMATYTYGEPENGGSGTGD